MKTLDEAVEEGFVEFKKAAAIAKAIEAAPFIEELIRAAFLTGVAVGGKHSMEFARDLLSSIGGNASNGP